MELSIVDRKGNVSSDMFEFAERRIRFALSRFGPKIRHVSLVLYDASVPGGGTDKVCRVTVKLRRMDDVELTASNTDMQASIARAADRVGRAVSRTIERCQQSDRRRPFVA